VTYAESGLFWSQCFLPSLVIRKAQAGAGKSSLGLCGNNYKIGCTSRDPEKRLKEIQRLEKNNDITLVGSVKANEMNGAETAAQEALKESGFVKDPARGGATDWFIGSSTPEQVLDQIRPPIYNHNAKNKNP
jgi:hypothetical protein